MERLERDAPFPAEMQGRWVDIEEPNSELVIQGSEVSCFGAAVAYDYKMVDIIEGALTVSLRINDQAAEDSFQRANIGDYTRG